MTLTTVTGPSNGGGHRRSIHIEPDLWYGVDEVAAHYGIPTSTTRELLAAGMLPASKVGRTWRVYGADILAADAARRAQGAKLTAPGPHPGPTSTPDAHDGAQAI